MEKQSTIRTIYLYIFALLGLTLMTIGGVRFVDMGLKTFVFTRADQDQNIYNKQPVMAPVPIEKLETASEEKVITLTEAEKISVTQWLADYKIWQEQSAKIDYVASQRHRDASINLALILIGLPLYLYHWTTIKKEAKLKVE